MNWFGKKDSKGEGLAVFLGSLTTEWGLKSRNKNK